MGCQTGSDGRPGLPCELCQSGSLTDGKPLPFEFECLLSWPLWPLRGINKTAWAAKLVLMAGLTYPVSCASLGHLLMANLCPLSLNVCFTPPTAPQPPPTPTPPPPTHPPPIDSIRVITEIEKNHLKNQIASRISYEILAI